MTEKMQQIIATVVLSVVFVLCVLSMAEIMRIDHACLRAGYPDYEAIWHLPLFIKAEGFCISADGTRAIPLQEVQGE